MASYTKRGKTWTYIISYKDKNGEFQTVRKGGFRTKPEAAAAAREIEIAIAKGHDPSVKKKLFSDYFKNWMELYKKPAVSEVTYRKYKVAYNTIKKLFPYETLEDLDRDTYQKGLNEYAKTAADSTVRRLNSYVKACLAYALEDNTIFRDPTFKAVISGNNERVVEEEAKFLEKKDYDKLMANLKPRPLTLSKMLVVIAAHTGARFSEILGLTWDDIDFEAKTVSISKTWLYKLKPPVFGETKNKKRRVILVSDDLLDFIKEIETHQELNGSKIDRIINAPCSSNAVNKYLRKVQTQTGVTENQITLHGMRHTHASLLIYADVNIMLIAERLGHKDVTVTQTVYSHVLEEMRKNKENQMRDSLKIF